MKEKMEEKIPLSLKVYWTAEDIAQQIGVTRKTFLMNYATSPTFPERISLPRAKTPIWKAKEIMAWIDRHRE